MNVLVNVVLLSSFFVSSMVSFACRLIHEFL